MGKLFAKYKVYREVPRNGDYIAKIADVHQFCDSLKVEFIPFAYVKGKLVRFAPVFLRINESNNYYSAAANFIEIFKEFDDFEDVVGSVVGITIKDNTKDGVVYHNVVDVFLWEDEEDEETETTEDVEEAETTEEVQEAEETEADVESTEQDSEAEEAEESEEDCSEEEEEF